MDGILNSFSDGKHLFFKFDIVQTHSWVFWIYFTNKTKPVRLGRFHNLIYLVLNVYCMHLDLLLKHFRFLVLKAELQMCYYQYWCNQ